MQHCTVTQQVAHDAALLLRAIENTLQMVQRNFTALADHGDTVLLLEGEERARFTLEQDQLKRTNEFVMKVTPVQVLDYMVNNKQ